MHFTFNIDNCYPSGDAGRLDEGFDCASFHAHSLIFGHQFARVNYLATSTLSADSDELDELDLWFRTKLGLMAQCELQNVVNWVWRGRGVRASYPLGSSQRGPHVSVWQPAQLAHCAPRRWGASNPHFQEFMPLAQRASLHYTIMPSRSSGSEADALVRG